jgi:REP element-mobilizing transposase RayT
MSRIPRSQLLYEGCYAHIISRPIRKERILNQEEDFIHFLNLLKEAKDKYPFNLFHYCLMQTHFHLVVQILSIKDFSKSLNYIKSRYALYFHTKYKLSGPIWRERYKSLLIEDQIYLHACGQYVEYNPVKAGIVNLIEEWEYSSAKYYLGIGSNSLINNYEVPQNAIKINYKNIIGFEEGNGIGSDYFKFKLRRGLK